VDVLIVDESIAVLKVIVMTLSNTTSTALSIGSVEVTSGQSPIIPIGSSDFLHPNKKTEKRIPKNHLLKKIGVNVFFIFFKFI
jgi:hypothetical protein